MALRKEAQLDLVFHALSDKSRRKILRLLTQNGTQNATELGKPLIMSKQAVSKHLKVLEEARLLKKEKEGREQNCTFNPEGLEDLERSVQELKRFWESQLDGLAKYIETLKNQE